MKLLEVVQMILDIGSRIRTIREKKGISLNKFAKIIGVSSGYLSNLESGRTNTVNLEVLNIIQTELNIMPIEEHSELSERIQRIERDLVNLNQDKPEMVQFILHNIEESIHYFTGHI